MVKLRLPKKKRERLRRNRIPNFFEEIKGYILTHDTIHLRKRLLSNKKLLHDMVCHDQTWSEIYLHQTLFLCAVECDNIYAICALLECGLRCQNNLSHCTLPDPLLLAYINENIPIASLLRSFGFTPHYCYLCDETLWDSERCSLLMAMKNRKIETAHHMISIFSLICIWDAFERYIESSVFNSEMSYVILNSMQNEHDLLKFQNTNGLTMTIYNKDFVKDLVEKKIIRSDIMLHITFDIIINDQEILAMWEGDYNSDRGRDYGFYISKCYKRHGYVENRIEKENALEYIKFLIREGADIGRKKRYMNMYYPDFQDIGDSKHTYDFQEVIDLSMKIISSGVRNAYYRPYKFFEVKSLIKEIKDEIGFVKHAPFLYSRIKNNVRIEDNGVFSETMNSLSLTPVSVFSNIMKFI